MICCLVNPSTPEGFDAMTGQGMGSPLMMRWSSGMRTATPGCNIPVCTEKAKLPHVPCGVLLKQKKQKAGPKGVNLSTKICDRVLTFVGTPA